MKMHILILVLSTVLVIQSFGNKIDIEGDFSPDIEKSLKWMVDKKHPVLLVDGKIDMDKVKQYREAVSSGDPLIHMWRNGKMRIQVTRDWIQNDTSRWMKIDKWNYKTVKPANKSNTEFKTTLTILDKNNYYIEITANHRVTREYFTRNHIENKRNKIE